MVIVRHYNDVHQEMAPDVAAPTLYRTIDGEVLQLAQHNGPTAGFVVEVVQPAQISATEFYEAAAADENPRLPPHSVNGSHSFPGPSSHHSGSSGATLHSQPPIPHPKHK